MKYKETSWNTMKHHENAWNMFDFFVVSKMFPASSEEISKDASTPRRPLEAAIAMAKDSWEQRDTNDTFSTFA